MLKIFLSSTSKDLAPYREAAFKAVLQMGHFCRRMEDFVSGNATPLELCRAEVRACDLFLCILGPLHGSCPPESAASFTELEYEAALAEPAKGRLVFRTADNFPLPASFRDSDDKFKRQQAFRARVGEERILHEFSSPDELAKLVTISIRNYEGASVRSGEEAAPDRGLLVSRMCDRIDQEDEFKKSFSAEIRKRPGSPQVYFVCGEERECPQSLIERLTQDNLGKYALLAGESKGTILPRDVEWPSEVELPQRFERLLGRLFEAFHPTYDLEHDTFSPADFARLAPLSSHPVVAVTHEIRASRWQRADLRFVERYLSFWDGVAAARPAALCVVFLCIIYPPEETRREPEAAGNGFDREGLKEALQKIKRKREIQRKREGSQVLCEPLTPLGCVREAHVMRWFSHHRIYDTKARTELCEEWFRSSACRHMEDIERELEKIHKSIRG